MKDFWWIGPLRLNVVHIFTFCGNMTRASLSLVAHWHKNYTESAKRTTHMNFFDNVCKFRRILKIHILDESQINCLALHMTMTMWSIVRGDEELSYDTSFVKIGSYLRPVQRSRTDGQTDITCFSSPDPVFSRWCPSTLYPGICSKRHPSIPESFLKST